MRTRKSLLFFVVAAGLVTFSSVAPAAEIGFGYGFETRNTTDLDQYEIFDRLPLPYTIEWGDIVKVSTAVELGAGLIHYDGTDDILTGRFSAMPMAILSPHPNINIIAGIGAGFMVGQTKFGDHDISGPLLLNAKVGLQVLLGENWGLEYTFYHQSNAHIYDSNDSLNMHQFAIAYRF